MIIEQGKIAELLVLASEFNANDVLVDLNAAEVIPFFEEWTLDWLDCRKLIAKAQATMKDQGINPLCLATGAITWERNGKEIQSPIFLTPVSFEINKVKKTVSLIENLDEVIVNPFLVKQMQVLYGISLENNLGVDELVEVLERKGFDRLDKNKRVLGNFHHHRYEILRELEALSNEVEYPFGLSKMLGLETEDVVEKLALPKIELLPADDDHRLAFDSFASDDLVIQGPPGTGKSQILTNFIGKLLLDEKSMVVVSEKRSALEVIAKKLETLKLDELCFISTPDLSSNHFLKSLKKSWDFYENYTPNLRNEISVRRELEENFALKMKMLGQTNLIGGTSYSNFKRMSEGLDFSKFVYRNRLPELELIDKKNIFIRQLFALNLQNLVGSLRFNFYEKELTFVAEQLDEFISFSHILSSKFDTNNLLELDVLVQKSISCQLFDHELAQKHLKILVPNSKEQRKFIKEAKKLHALQSELDETNNLSEWKKVPSEVELASIKKELNHGSFWDKRRAKKRWADLSHLSLGDSSRSIKILEKRYALISEYQNLKSLFAEQQIQEIQTEIPQLLNLIPLFTEEKWEIYQSLTKKDSASIHLFESKINRFKANFKHFFNLHEAQNFCDFFQELKLNFHLLIEHQRELSTLNAVCLESMRDESSYDSFLATILGSHFTDFKNMYPILATFNMRELGKEIDAIIESETLDQEIAIRQIHQRVFEKFKAYQTLLSSPANKLSQDQKALKSTLRKGKALLVKEFAKTKSHPSLRELFASDARLWITLLKPIWLSNPAQLAKSFPLEKDVFDICVFDEASQIPLQNGIGALYRSRRIIIAGDEEQMGPTNYFKSGSAETISLLQHAQFYLKRVALKHHYRSAHPALIGFSNLHFYNNELVVFPSYPIDNNPISYHHIENGTFENRRNNEEAKKVVHLLAEHVDTKETIGIVGFSQEQVDCIWEHMTESLKSKAENLIEQNVLFIKPLEKVQGDECAHLIISMGYAKDEEGNFAMRFGPLNQASGRNRLNVLFSRASQKINFVTSVLPEEMKLSENESVNLLRQWLRYAHDHSNNSAQKLNQTIETQFPFNLKPDIDHQTLTFSNVHEDLNSANEMITLHRVLKQRAWKLNYK